MIKSHVLAALAAGIEAGDDAVACEVLAQADWVLRGPAKRRMQRALIDAMLLTGDGYGDADDPDTLRHVQRVAALDVAGRLLRIDARDRAAVAASYAQLARRAPSTAPVATLVAGAGVAVAVLLFVWLSLRVRTPERPLRRSVPAMAGAYLHGGRPAYDVTLAQFLETELTALVIETDADRRGSSEGAPRAQRVKELRDAPVIVSRGPALARAWRALIDQLDRWVEISVHDKGFRDAIRQLGQRAQDVSEQLGALGLGYYISADVIVRGSTARAVIFSYEVEDVAFVRVAGDTRRVLSLRRLDRLNLDLALLGRQGDELGDPVVMLDHVDDLVEDRVLPVLEGETYRLGDPRWRLGSTSGRLLAAHAAGGIERELRAVLGPAVADRDARTRIARQLVTATVRRHEARHAVDNERARSLRYPQPLEYLLGSRTRATLRAELELAAYLSQIANDPATPQFSLWNLAGHAFNTRWGSAESYVAVVILEGLARQIGQRPARPLVMGGSLDREALARLARPLASLDGEQLRTAARTLWNELYGEPLVPIIDVAPR